MIYIGNAFSLSMLDPSRDEYGIYVTRLTIEDVIDLLENNVFESVVGHQSTADVLTQLLGIDIEMNRKMLKLTRGDTLIVFQLMTRLPEGKILSQEELENLDYTFYLVEI
jgi:hypothetical protein